MQSPRVVYITPPQPGQPKVDANKLGGAWVTEGMVSPNIPQAVLAQHHEPIAYRTIPSPTLGPAQNEVPAIGPQVIQYVVPKNGLEKKDEEVDARSNRLVQQPMIHAAPGPRAVNHLLPQIYQQVMIHIFHPRRQLDPSSSSSSFIFRESCKVSISTDYPSRKTTAEACSYPCRLSKPGT